jgi:hypothetical protein
LLMLIEHIKKKLQTITQRSVLHTRARKQDSSASLLNDTETEASTHHRPPLPGPSRPGRATHQRRCTLAVTLEHSNRHKGPLTSPGPPEPLSSSPRGLKCFCPTVRPPFVKAQARGRHVSDRFLVALPAAVARARPAGTWLSLCRRVGEMLAGFMQGVRQARKKVLLHVLQYTVCWLKRARAN